MTALRFAFVLHIHQPVGNFDFVFREHAVDVYSPFLDFVEERALWPLGLHVSGPLLQWMGENDPRLHDRIGRWASDGRVELLSSGFYEPILAALSSVDRATQIGWMRDELVTRFGVTPRGLWLTERVWVPELTADLADAGIEYTMVDDHLVRRAGASDEALTRPIRTRHDGRSLDVFAIDERLRYLIPFRPAPDVADELRQRHQAGEPFALYADDGEKFGGWPRTHEWLYDQGWLAAFGDEMDRLRGEDVVRLVTPAVALDELGSGAELELPIGSYPEMDVWASGPWTNFLDRYDEAGRLHTWMSELSAACFDAGDPPEARRAVGRAQCNDAYWHGVFGGLYMKHLREGVRGWMAAAQRYLSRGEAISWHVSRDRGGAEAHSVRSERVWARVTGAAGGTINELVWLQPTADVTDYLTRRREAYHVEAVERGRAPAPFAVDGSETASIHDIEEAATLDRLPPADPEVRVLFRDRVLASDLSFELYRNGTFDSVGASVGSRDLPLPEPVETGSGALVWSVPESPMAGVEKKILISDDRVEVEWRWHPEDLPPDARFSPEFSLACPVDIAFDPAPAEVWRYPIVTVSKCPDGFEEIEQGTSVTPRWRPGVGRARVVLRPR